MMKHFQSLFFGVAACLAAELSAADWRQPWWNQGAAVADVEFDLRELPALRWYREAVFDDGGEFWGSYEASIVDGKVVLASGWWSGYQPRIEVWDAANGNTIKYNNQSMRNYQIPAHLRPESGFYVREVRPDLEIEAFGWAVVDSNGKRISSDSLWLLNGADIVRLPHATGVWTPLVHTQPCTRDDLLDLPTYNLHLWTSFFFSGHGGSLNLDQAYQAVAPSGCTTKLGLVAGTSISFDLTRPDIIETGFSGACNQVILHSGHDPNVNEDVNFNCTHIAFSAQKQLYATGSSVREYTATDNANHPDVVYWTRHTLEEGVTVWGMPSEASFNGHTVPGYFETIGKNSDNVHLVITLYNDYSANPVKKMLLAWNYNSGELAWAVDLGTASVGGVTASGRHLITNVGGQLIQLDATTGEYMASALLPEGWEVWGKPKVVDGGVLIDGEYYDAEADEAKSGLFMIGLPEAGYPVQGSQGLGPDLTNTLTGNKLFTIQDLQLPGLGLSIEINRTYNSSSMQALTTVASFGFGRGWSFNYGMQMSKFGPAGVNVARGDGRFLRFVSIKGRDQATRYPLPGSGVREKVVIEGGEYVMRHPDGTRHVFQSPELESPLRGRLLRIEEPTGKSLTFDYGAQGQLESVQDATGRLVQFQTLDGRITQMTDPMGRVTRYNYDGDQRLISVDGPGGYAAQYTYAAAQGQGPAGKLETMRDRRAPSGKRLMRFSYDRSGRITESVNLESTSVRHAYRYSDDDDSTYGWPAGFKGEDKIACRIQDPLGRVSFDGHEFGRLTASLDPIQARAEFTWAGSGFLDQTKDPRGSETKYDYDDDGDLRALTDALGHRSAFEYNTDFKRLRRSVDPLGRVTQYIYRAGTPLLEKVIDPLNKETIYDYDGLGRRISARDPRGKITYFEYDPHGNVNKITDPLGRIRRFEFDVLSRKTAEVDPLGNRMVYHYDDADRVVRVVHPPVDGIAIETRYEYDQHGNLTRSIDPNGNAIRYNYNQRYPGRDLLEDVIEEPGNRTTRFDYDAAGNRTSVTDPNGKVTQFAYDALNRLERVTDAEGGVIRYGYDPAGNMSRIEAPNGNVTVQEYDALNRLVRVTDPNGLTIHEYDAAGNHVSSLDPRERLVRNAYDALNRLVRTDFTAPDAESRFVEHDYDEAGNRVARRDTSQPSGVIYTYDDASQLISEQVPLLPWLKEYQYDLNGRRKELKLSGTDFEPQSPSIEPFVRRYEYDALGRITKVKDGGEQSVRVLGGFTYDKGGRLLRAGYENATAAIYDYDAGNRLRFLEHQRNYPGASNPALKPSVLETFRYGYDNINNRISVEHNGRETQYVYDNLYRLTKALFPPTGLEERDATLCPACPAPALTVETLTWAYDSAGNRVSQGRVVDGQPQLAAYLHEPATNRLRSRTGVNVPSTVYDYDASGNLILRGSQTLTYDAADRLIRADRLDTPGTVSFSYDGDNNRIRRQILGGETRVYVTDGLNTLAEADPQSNRPLATYTYGPSGLIHKALYSPHTPAPPAQDLFFHQDGLGSTALITNQDGEVLERYEYDPFGQPLGGVSLLNQHAFTGKEHEPEVGLQYFNARWLDPSTGRFTQVDPVVGDALHSQDWNQYAYVRNNPVNLTDPTGKEALTLALGAAAVLALYGATPEGYDKLTDGFEALADAIKFGYKKLVEAATKIEEAVNKPAEGGQSGETPKAEPAQSAAASMPPSEDPDKQEKKNEGEKKDVSVNQIQKLIDKGKSPKSITRIDKGQGFEKTHIHFKDGHALNVDGTFKHGGRVLTNAELKFLREVGFNVP